MSESIDELTEQLKAFNSASDAEEYFDILEVPYDDSVVDVNRLHILKMFAGDVAEINERLGTDASAGDLLVEYRQALETAYRAFTESGALDHRLFKVLRDHAPETLEEANQTFVPLTAITIGPPDRETSATPPADSPGCGCGGSPCH